MHSPPWTRDELVLACALVVKNGWRELRENDRAVQELSELLRSLPLNDGIAGRLPQYRSVGSVSRKTSDLATNHPEYQLKRTKGGRLDLLVIKDFIDREAEMLAAAQAIEDGIGSGEIQLLPPQPDELDENGDAAPEGRLLTRWALVRERDSKLRRRKIDEVRGRGAPLQCEACEFHFEKFYGELGLGYIEVHHRLPLHVSGPRDTRLQDLALVCANCHRMCHRNHGGMSWRTPEAVQKEIARAAQHSIPS